MRCLAFRVFPGGELVDEGLEGVGFGAGGVEPADEAVAAAEGGGAVEGPQGEPLGGLGGADAYTRCGSSPR